MKGSGEELDLKNVWKHSEIIHCLSNKNVFKFKQFKVSDGSWGFFGKFQWAQTKNSRNDQAHQVQLFKKKNLFISQNNQKQQIKKSS